MIRFLDLKKLNDSFEPALSAAVKKVLDSGWYVLGTEVRAFEEEYAAFTGTEHCIGVASGLDALKLIFRAYLELGEMKTGDEVIVPANTFIASMLAISWNDLVPVPVEPDIHTYNLDISLVEQHITDRTRAVLPVHLYGRVCWSEQLTQLADKYGLKIVEDNAQAAGAMALPGKQPPVLRRTGSLGDAAGHSFYPGKNMGALGDGGAITTDDHRLAGVIRSLANYGSQVRYYNQYKGVNSRLDEIQAAMLRVKLPRLDYDNRRRQEIARYYIKHIQHPGIILPQDPGTGHVWHLFVIRSPHRDDLQNYLIDNGIETGIHYPVPPHRQEAYAEWSGRTLPVTETIHREVLSLPMSQVLKDVETEMITDCLNRYVG